MTKEKNEGLINARQIAEMIGASLRTVRSMRKDCKLPKPVSISPRMVRWKKSDIHLWIKWGCPNEELFERLKIQSKEGKPFPRLHNRLS